MSDTYTAKEQYQMKWNQPHGHEASRQGLLKDKCHPLGVCLGHDLDPAGIAIKLYCLLMKSRAGCFYLNVFVYLGN